MENCQVYDTKPLVMQASHIPQVVYYEPPVKQQCQQQQPQLVQNKAIYNESDGSIPVSWATVTQVTGAAMGAILLYCGYQACTTGQYECSSTHLPDISHVMGHEPLNKLYAIMLTVYAFVKQGYVRAYHHRFNGIASAGTQKAMIIYACLSCIFGPMIGFFDVFYNMHVHCFVVALFTAGEVLYMYTAVGILKSAPEKFPGHDSTISLLVNMRYVSFILGVITLGAKVLRYDIGVYSAVIEWTEFEMSFVMFAMFASVMPYRNCLSSQQ